MKKHQAPNSKFQINSNIQCSNFGIFGHCNLKFIWSLVLGIWNFKTRIYPSFIFIFALCSLLFTFNFSSAHAAGAQNSFTESLTTSGVVDTTPPSVPTGLAATAISQSEIDLVWSPSTDNVAVGGYVLYRDSNAIATTTATNFADTLLTASTTYTYNVQAFDTSYNYSALSAPVSTSTLPVPIIPLTPTSTPPVTGQGGTNSGSSLIYNVHISADSGNAIVSFLTTLPAQSTVSYGLTPDYEIGSISSVLYDTSHQVILSGLDPETHYYVQITANAANGSQSSFITEFTTAGLPGTPLPNPSDFRAVPTTNAIDLSWTNTTDPRANEVRIVRSETFFPSDQFDGVPIYEGPGQSFRDTSAVAGKTYYYAIFSEGANGLFSSGVLAKARIPLLGEIISFATSTNPFAGITFVQNVNPMIAGLTLADFQFIQESKQLAIAGNNIIGVNGQENMTIRLPYNKVPQILKTIATTLNDPTDSSKAFIFLLRANTDKTYYEASIGPLGRTGIFPLTITILDYQNQGLKQLSGSLAALAIGAYPMVKGFNPTWLWIGLALLVVILLVIAAMWKKDKENRKEKREKRNEEGNKIVVPVIQTQTI
jgi:chitodextrinase